MFGNVELFVILKLLERWKGLSVAVTTTVSCGCCETKLNAKKMQRKKQLKFLADPEGCDRHTEAVSKTACANSTTAGSTNPPRFLVDCNRGCKKLLRHPARGLNPRPLDNNLSI